MLSSHPTITSMEATRLEGDPTDRAGGTLQGEETTDRLDIIVTIITTSPQVLLATTTMMMISNYQTSKMTT